MKKIVFLSAQPDASYFHWQVEVIIHNFIAVGINPNWIEIVFGYSGDSVSKEYWELAKRYPFVRFFNYKRTLYSDYVLCVRPDVLEQHFTVFPELRREVIFYHDADIILRVLPNFDQFHDDHYWYMSDTISYIGAEYIQSKSPTILSEMCKVIGIDSQIVIENQAHSGGAQTLMKGVTKKFWNNTKDCVSLYTFLCNLENEERSVLVGEQLNAYFPIQKWTAEMWSLLWNAWKSGVNTRVTKELDFSWATSSLFEYNRCKIMHNAGATTSENGLFYKGEFITRSPFDADLSFVTHNTASHEYVKWIQYAAEQRKLF